MSHFPDAVRAVPPAFPADEGKVPVARAVATGGYAAETAPTGYSTGLESALPATAPDGTRYRATDVRGDWLMSGGGWKPSDADPRGVVSLGGWQGIGANDTILRSLAGHADPQFQRGSTGAVLVYVKSVPAGTTVIYGHHILGGASKGFDIAWEAGSLQVAYSNAGAVTISKMPQATLAAAGLYCVAFCVPVAPGAQLRYAVNGVAHNDGGVALGAYAACDATCFSAIGSAAWTATPVSLPCLALDPIAVALWPGWESADADLIAISSRWAEGYIPGVAGQTKGFDWRAGRDIIAGGRSVSQGATPVAYAHWVHAAGAGLSLTPR